jgi:hypothetical protein
LGPLTVTSLVTEQRLVPCLTLRLVATLASVRSSIGRYTHFPVDIFAVQFHVVTYYSGLPLHATLMSQAALCFKNLQQARVCSVQATIC